MISRALGGEDGDELIALDASGAQDISAQLLAARQQAEASAQVRRAEREREESERAARQASRAGRHEPTIVCSGCGQPWPCPDAG